MDRSNEVLLLSPNVQDLLADGQTLWQKGRSSLLEVKFFPISAKDQGRVHQFGTKVFPGMFMGYSLDARRKLDR